MRTINCADKFSLNLRKLCRLSKSMNLKTKRITKCIWYLQAITNFRLLMRRCWPKAQESLSLIFMREDMALRGINTVSKSLMKEAKELNFMKWLNYYWKVQVLLGVLDIYMILCTTISLAIILRLWSTPFVSSLASKYSRIVMLP